MTEKKIPTVEQLNDFRQQVKTAVTSSDYDKLNAFMEEDDLYTKVFEESGKMGVKGFIDSKGAFTTDEEEAYFGAFCD